MWTGKVDPEREDLPKAKRFRQDVFELSVGNDIAANRAARIAHNASLAGARGVDDLAKLKGKTNVSRDLLRKAFRNSKWPTVYETGIPFSDYSTRKNFIGKLSFLLPHEIIHSLLKVNSVDFFRGLQGPELSRGRPDLLECMHRVQREYSLDEPPLMLGLWIDGVPFNSDRSQSLECVTLSICGLKDWRMPLVCFPQPFKRKQETFEAIFEVLLWSFRCLILDSLPCNRHDGGPWQPSDAYRTKLCRKGDGIGTTAVLAELRGDWSMLKEVLHVPSWNSYRICWQCQCTKDMVKDVSRDAAWRRFACNYKVAGLLRGGLTAGVKTSCEEVLIC